MNTMEINRVHAGVGDVGRYFYSDAEWPSLTTGLYEPGGDDEQPAR